MFGVGGHHFVVRRLLQIKGGAANLVNIFLYVNFNKLSLELGWPLAIRRISSSVWVSSTDRVSVDDDSAELQNRLKAGADVCHFYSEARRFWKLRFGIVCFRIPNVPRMLAL